MYFSTSLPQILFGGNEKSVSFLGKKKQI